MVGLSLDHIKEEVEKSQARREFALDKGEFSLMVVLIFHIGRREWRSALLLLTFMLGFLML